MKKTRSFLLTAGLALATAFTLSCSEDKDDTPKILAACYSTSSPAGDAFCMEFFDEAVFNMTGGTPEAFCQFMEQKEGIPMTPRESCPQNHTLKCPTKAPDPEATLYLYGAPAGFTCEDIK